jgi:hypothetical protein
LSMTVTLEVDGLGTVLFFHATPAATTRCCWWTAPRAATPRCWPA